MKLRPITASVGLGPFPVLMQSPYRNAVSIFVRSVAPLILFLLIELFCIQSNVIEVGRPQSSRQIVARASHIKSVITLDYIMKRYFIEFTCDVGTSYLI